MVMGMGYAMIFGFWLPILVVIAIGLRVFHVAETRAKAKGKKKRMPMKWQESKEYQ